MTKFRPKTRVMPCEEYEALRDRIRACQPIVRVDATDLTWWMLDSDWLPTPSMAEVRFTLVENGHGHELFIVDDEHNTILIEPN